MGSHTRPWKPVACEKSSTGVFVPLLGPPKKCSVTRTPSLESITCCALPFMANGISPKATSCSGVVKGPPCSRASTETPTRVCGRAFTQFEGQCRRPSNPEVSPASGRVRARRCWKPVNFGGDERLPRWAAHRERARTHPHCRRARFLRVRASRTGGQGRLLLRRQVDDVLRVAVPDGLGGPGDRLVVDELVGLGFEQCKAR